MSSFLGWSRKLITFAMVLFVTTACVRPNFQNNFCPQQDRDDDDDGDGDENGNPVEKQLEALSSGLLRSRQAFASSGAIVVGEHSGCPRHLSRYAFRPTSDHSRLRPRLFLRLQI